MVVRAVHFVTMDGFAFNVNTDLNYFKYIKPCGFKDKEVTSMKKQPGGKQDMNKGTQVLNLHIGRNLKMDYTNRNRL